MTTYRLALAAAMAACAACASPRESPPAMATSGDPPPASAAGDTVPVRRFGDEVYARIRYNGGLTERGEQVVRDAAAWSALWARMTARQSPSAVPAVDFGSEMVLVAAMGQRPSGGYGVTIERVEDAGAELVASVVHQRPGAGCGVTAALTEPVDAVRVPRAAKPVRWSVREVVRDC